MEWWKMLIVLLTPVLFYAMIRAIVPLAVNVCEIKEKREEQFKYEFEMLKASARELINKQKEGEKERMGYTVKTWELEPSLEDNLCYISSIQDAYITASEMPTRRRLRCEYCGCISGKEHGTCEHCGAPLKEMDE